MATVIINNSPVHSDAIITALFGEYGSSWQNFHTGTDFAPFGGYQTNPPLFSVCTGTVAKVEYGSALGNQIVIKDSQTNLYWRYCHMQSASPLHVGDTVTTATQVGIMR